jgi:hypothetical protein
MRVDPYQRSSHHPPAPYELITAPSQLAIRARSGRPPRLGSSVRARSILTAALQGGHELDVASLLRPSVEGGLAGQRRGADTSNLTLTKAGRSLVKMGLHFVTV